MLESIVAWIFREDETVSPRVVVGFGLFAYIVLFAAPVLGWLYYLLVPFMIVALAVVGYAAIRVLAPMLDPSDPESDKFVVWGSAILFVFVGLASFGIVFIPAFAGAIGLVHWRAPVLKDLLPRWGERLSTYEHPRER